MGIWHTEPAPEVSMLKAAAGLGLVAAGVGFGATVGMNAGNGVSAFVGRKYDDWGTPSERKELERLRKEKTSKLTVSEQEELKQLRTEKDEKSTKQLEDKTKETESKLSENEKADIAFRTKIEARIDATDKRIDTLRQDMKEGFANLSDSLVKRVEELLASAGESKKAKT